MSSRGETLSKIVDQVMSTDRRSVVEIATNYFPWLLVVLTYLVSGLIFPDLFTIDTLETVLVQSTPVIILSIGMATTLIVAEIDLSIVTALLFAPLVGIKSIEIFGLPGVVALAIIPLVGAAIGLFNGLVITKIGVPSLIQTLAAWWIMGGLVLTITGGRSLSGFPSTFSTIGSGSIGPVRYVIVTALIMIALIWFYTTQMVGGRRLFIVGDDPDAASRVGIDVNRYKRHAFIISGVAASIGGVVLVTRLGVLSSGIGTDLLIPAIAAPVISGIPLTGGQGRLINVPAGALLVQVILTITRVAGISGDQFQLAQGVLIFVAVILNEVRKRYDITRAIGDSA